MRQLILVVLLGVALGVGTVLVPVVPAVQACSNPPNC